MSTDIDHLAAAKKHVGHTKPEYGMLHALIAIAERLPDRQVSPDYVPRPLYSYDTKE